MKAAKINTENQLSLSHIMISLLGVSLASSGHLADVGQITSPVFSSVP